jgi:hypothetical protein
VTAPVDTPNVNEVSCVALTQEHRGHGVSTAAFYLGRALVEQGLHVLVGDLSQRPTQLAALAQHDPIKNLVPWAPSSVAPRDLTRLIQTVRSRVAGRADVILLDADVHLLERAGGLATGINYVVIFAEHTPEGTQGAARLAARWGGEDTSRSRVAVVFSRVDAPSAESVPPALDNGIPVLGWLPADYLLAAGEAYSLKGGVPARPHEVYLGALARIAQALIHLVPLHAYHASTSAERALA